MITDDNGHPLGPILSILSADIFAHTYHRAASSQPLSCEAMPQMDLFGNVAVLTLDDGPDVTEPEPPPPKRGRGRGRARSRARLVGAGGGTAGVGGNPATDGADAAAVGDGRASEVAGSTASGSGGGHRADVYLEGVPPPSRVEPEGAPPSPGPELGGVPTTPRPELEGVPTTPRVEPGEIVTTFSTLTFDTGIYCTKCGYTVDPLVLGTRVVRKSPPSFCCSKCNSKTVMLSRMFGSWPPEEFKGIDDATMQKFFATPVADKDSLQKAVEDTLVSRLVESQIAEDSGPYLPLATWADAPYHFDPAEIRAKAPMRMHHILGETYQVKIVTTGERKQRDVVRETMAKLMGRVSGLPSSSTELPAIKADADADAEGAGDDEGGDDKASSKSSSSSSSSSSSTDGRRKKTNKNSTKSKKSKKPAKKHKKAQSSKKSRRAAQKDKDRQKKAAKEEAAAEKAEKARVLRLKTECSKVLGKITPVTMQLDQILKDKVCSQIPSVVLKKSQDVLATLTAYEKETKDKLKVKCPLDLTFTMDSVLSLCKEATMHKNHLTILIDSVRKM